MSAVLKAVPTTPPPRSPEREALHRAIQQFTTAEQRLAKLEDARERASSNATNLFSAVSAAKVAVDEAQAGEGRYLAAVALNEADASASPITAARERLAQLEVDLGRAKKTSEALGVEASDAERELTNAKFNLDAAVKAVVTTDAATQQLLDHYKTSQADYLDACKLISSLSGLGCSLLPSWGEGYSPQHNFASRGESPEASAWQAAIEKLKSDPDAELPTG